MKNTDKLLAKAAAALLSATYRSLEPADIDTEEERDPFAEELALEMRTRRYE